MHTSISASLLLTLLTACMGLPSAIARPYEGYVLTFELMPDNDGNVIDCKLRRATHYSSNELQDPAEFHGSAALLQDACSTFSHWKVDVRRDSRGHLQTADAPWPCFVRDYAPDKIECHAFGRERVPVD